MIAIFALLKGTRIQSTNAFCHYRQTLFETSLLKSYEFQQKNLFAFVDECFLSDTYIKTFYSYIEENFLQRSITLHALLCAIDEHFSRPTLTLLFHWGNYTVTALSPNTYSFWAYPWLGPKDRQLFENFSTACMCIVVCIVLALLKQVTCFCFYYVSSQHINTFTLYWPWDRTTTATALC